MKYLLKKSDFINVSLGAIPAAILRWQIDEILLVNIIGCFFLGFINAAPIGKKFKLIFAFGFCGSLTTFSGLSFYLYSLLSQGLYIPFLFNAILIVLLGIFAVGLGHLLAKKITY